MKIISRKAYNIFLIVIALLIVVDALITYHFIFNVTGFIEMNPILNYIIQRYGIMGFILYNALSLMLWYFFSQMFYKIMQNFEGKKFYYVLPIGIVIFIILVLMPVINNLYWVFV